MPFTFLTSADLAATGLDDTGLRRACRRGELHRVRRGLYLPTSEWADLDERSRHRALIAATAQAVGTRLIFSHESAGALWGFPVLDSWPSAVHVSDPGRATGKKTAAMVRHPGRVSEPAERDGLLCTSAPRTAVDVALAQGFTAALMVFDFGLAEQLFTLDELRADLLRRPTARRRRAVGSAIDLADGQSGSPGESISRAAMHEMGIPRPALQEKFRGPNGERYFADFWWEQFGIVGEFDGDEKYLDARLRGGRTLERVLLDEKTRRDTIAANPRVTNIVRWKYATARRPLELANVLTAAGLPRSAA